MEQKKKLTNAQLQKRIANALIHIDRTKDTETIFFVDKGLRLTINEDVAIIATGFHRHVFNNFTSSGISRPYLYTKRVIEIANENIVAVETEDGYSFAKLLDVLKAKEDKSEYNIVVYYEWFLFNIFQPLYGIGETEIESFLVYEDYLHNIARNAILLSEKMEDMTNKQFIQKVIDNIKEFTSELEERVLFPKKTDEQVMQEEVAAAASLEVENAMPQEIEK